MKATARADTFYLGRWTFDLGQECTDEGWTTHDLTEQTGCYWHIDDFAGLGGGGFGRLNPLEGSQSVWCGARPDTNSLILCGYAALPGYGNIWDQSWCFKCVEVPDTETVSISYLAAWDTEPGYDYGYIEYATKSTCDSLQSIDDLHKEEWIEVASFDGIGSKTLRIDSIPAGHNGAIKIRFRFESDGGWSDEDGLWDTDGALIIDSITVQTAFSVLDFDDFEDELPGDSATTDNDWKCEVMTGYGDFAGLFTGLLVLQDEDPCIRNNTCLWAFIKGSTETYACGGYPDQPAVPKGNERGQFIANDIWSPLLPFSGGTATIQLVFDVYLDNPIPNLVFSNWRVRSWVGGCPHAWRDRSFLNPFPMDGWGRNTQNMGDLIDPAASYIQVALQVVDMCGVWCIVFGDGACHSHAPLYDNVEVRRITSIGSVWSVRDIDLFQDTFPSDGTDTGTGRVDAAVDILPYQPYGNIRPGDSAIVTCSDPDAGLREPEPYTGFGAAIYFYLWVDGPTASRPATGMEAPQEPDEPVNRWPLVDSVICDGNKWYIFRCDTAFTEPGGPRTGVVPDRYCIDLNDDYFVAKDTLWFFFGGENANNQWTWWGQHSSTVGTIEEACAAPMEMQILPSHGGEDGDILYVDNFSGRGGQPYFDSAFRLMGIFDEVDRYDKRGPASLVGNSIGHRVKNVANQLHPNYRKIIWNSGDLRSGTVGDGTDEKADDFATLLTFIDQHPSTDGVGIYFSGDDMAEDWAGLTGTSGFAFTGTYIPHVLVTGDHKAIHAMSPWVIGEPGGIFDHGLPLGVDTVVVYGGCPLINDFDQIQPIGSTALQMTYSGTGNPTDGAVLSFDTTNALGNPVGVVLSGFSFHYIRDDRPGGIPDRVDHLTDIIRWLQNILPDPVGAGDTPQYTNRLAQNYPNPFNPATTIKYSIKERAHVTLKIYNVAGQLVKTLVNEEQLPRAGGFTVRWDGRSSAGNPVASGVYFYRIVAGDFTQTKKMVLLK